MARRSVDSLPAFLVVVFVLLASCTRGRGEGSATIPSAAEKAQAADVSDSPPVESSSGSPGERPGALPPGHPAPALPPGHPQIADAAGTTIAPPAVPAAEKSLSWKVPAGWVEEKPSSAMRRAQYRVSGPGGDGQCVVFYFGPGQGGDAMANARRWADQFRQPDGNPSGAALKTSTMRVNGIELLLAEVAGTYSGGGVGMQRTEEKPNYMLLGAVAGGPDANWFFKFTGPEATVRDQRARFEEVLASLKKSS